LRRHSPQAHKFTSTIAGQANGIGRLQKSVLNNFGFRAANFWIRRAFSRLEWDSPYQDEFEVVTELRLVMQNSEKK
jgi:hypothetical protein